MKRREFVVKSAMAGMMAPIAIRNMADTSPTKNMICTFSKTFQWLGYDDLAVFLAEAGFEGIDLSVRPGGHVLPENVERDLPAAVKAAQKQRLSIPMMVTGITDATDPLTERILKTAADQGVKLPLGILQIRQQRVYTAKFRQSAKTVGRVVRVKRTIWHSGRLSESCRRQCGKSGLGSLFFTEWSRPAIYGLPIRRPPCRRRRNEIVDAWF